MKIKQGMSVMIALALVAFGLLFGTWSGYREDRAQVTELLSMENGLMAVMDYRAADGLNLCVVARRHLDAADQDLIALETAARELQQAGDPGIRNRADKAMGEAAAAVTRKLNESASFQASERDQRYLAMLSADLSKLAGSAAVSTYNEAAADFNKQLEAPVFGVLARLLGIEKCPLYQ